MGLVSGCGAITTSDGSPGCTESTLGDATGHFAIQTLAILGVGVEFPGGGVGRRCGHDVGGVSRERLIESLWPRFVSLPTMSLCFDGKSRF